MLNMLIYPESYGSDGIIYWCWAVETPNRDFVDEAYDYRSRELAEVAAFNTVMRHLPPCNIDWQNDEIPWPLPKGGWPTIEAVAL